MKIKDVVRLCSKIHEECEACEASDKEIIIKNGSASQKTNYYGIC